MPGKLCLKSFSIKIIARNCCRRSHGSFLNKNNNNLLKAWIPFFQIFHCWSWLMLQWTWAPMTMTLCSSVWARIWVKISISLCPAGIMCFCADSVVCWLMQCRFASHQGLTTLCGLYVIVCGSKLCCVTRSTHACIHAWWS